MTTPAAIPSVNSTVSLGGFAPANELFAVTDEQILEIEPVAQGESASLAGLSAGVSTPSSHSGRSEKAAGLAPLATGHANAVQAATSDTAEPPPWLAAQMRDPWSGEEARELWNGVQQAQQEAAAYREVFAKPEDARALKELHPGGIEQARATAQRARTLEEIDSAFYGGAGKSPEQLSAGRTALAQRMLREDPAAFREMVFAGLRALEEAGASPTVGVPIRSGSLDFATVARTREGPDPVGAATSSETATNRIPVGARHAVPVPDAADHAQLGAYRAFEKSANEELESSVGGAINRALAQALPDVQPGDGGSSVGARYIAPLQQRLGGAIRADVESALKGDQQLGEQIAQVLASRRFDDSVRAQVVRLINDRAQQLVPIAARRVIQDWTQAAFAAHRNRNENPVAQGESASPAGISVRAAPQRATSPAISTRATAADRAEKTAGLAPRAPGRPDGRALDYRKLSDEQILAM
jgi:hypothetical protein